MTSGLILDRPHGVFLRSPGSGWDAPAWCDLRAHVTRIENQGNTPQCAAYALTSICEMLNWRHTGLRVELDPVKLYEEAKRIDGAPREEGTTLHCAYNAARNIRYLPEGVTGFREIASFDGWQWALHRGAPVFAGFNISEEWGRAGRDGKVADGGRLIGGHAVVGVQFAPNEFGVANSWGEACGADGCVRLSAAEFDRQFMYGLVLTGADGEPVV